MVNSRVPSLDDIAIALPMFLIAIVFSNRYWLGTLLANRVVKRKRHKRNDNLPNVTVVVPLFNEGYGIYETLRSVSAQQYPRDRLSVVVIDDCSTDDSLDWATKAALEDYRIRVVENKSNIGKRLGIAHAVREAKSDFIVSVDSDVRLLPNAIENLMARFTNGMIAAVGGRVWVSNAQQNWLTKMQSIKYFFGYEYLKNVERACGTILCLSGCLTAYRRDVLLNLEPVLLNRNIRGIGIKYGEDRFLTRQIVRRGYLTLLELNAQCLTKAPHTLATYFAQQIRWRRSNIVDFLGGLNHIWRLHPLVVVHYLTINTLTLMYPLVLWISALSGSLFFAMSFHIGVLAVFALVYGIKTRHLNPDVRVNPANFLWMAMVMPVTYMVLSVLALFTLDSGNWETRAKVETRLKA
jgi:cellulose synthase/poly-beta-1,6-N-acetylglucosamine synthase-like glycosyltransferase